jgi:hypothetical protein
VNKLSHSFWARGTCLSRKMNLLFTDLSIMIAARFQGAPPPQIKNKNASSFYTKIPIQNKKKKKRQK